MMGWWVYFVVGVMIRFLCGRVFFFCFFLRWFEEDTKARKLGECWGLADCENIKRKDRLS